MAPEREMPCYVSHKEVHALKIAAIEFAADGSAMVAPADKGFAAFPAKAGYRAKFRADLHGDQDDLGYFVVYKDGYESWSPTKAFEEGYTKVIR